jgi:type IV pilus assembly protein PilC
MSTFAYRISRLDGTIVEGQADGYDENSVRSSLEGQGYLVLELLRKDGQATIPFKLSTGRRKITSQDFLIFNRELLAMLKAGLPVLQIFDLLIEQSGAGAFHDALVTVRQDIRGGSAASDAFAKHPGYFSGLYVASVRAGEQSGNLTGVLARYISYLKLMIELRQKVMKALAYPGFLVIVGFAVVGFLLVYVMPTFVSVYGESAAQLPAATQALIDVIHIVQSNLIWILGLLALGIIAFRSWYKTPAGRLTADKNLLKLPMLGRVLVHHNTVQLTHTLATVLAGGIPLIDALKFSGEAVSNKHIMNGVLNAVEDIRQGVTLGGSLKKQQILPKLAIEMLSIGEETGALEPMLRDVAEFYEGDLDLRLTQLTTWIEPVLLLVMGVLVGAVVIIMYLPVFQMAGNMQ